MSKITLNSSYIFHPVSRVAFKLTYGIGQSDSKEQKQNSQDTEHRLAMLQNSTPVTVQCSQQFRGRRNWYSEAFDFMTALLLSISRRTE